MATKKPSKNNPDNKKQSQKSLLVTSSSCEACLNKCERGIKYLERLQRTNSGFGVVCEKLK